MKTDIPKRIERSQEVSSAAAGRTGLRRITVESSDLQDGLREAMASVSAPVSVVTTMANGLPRGTTVSAFASLSMGPPMVLISLNRDSELLATIRDTRTFGLNVLSSTQSEMALKFAQKGGVSKFVSVEWKLEGGVPRLPGTCGFAAGEVSEFVDGGDHVILLGLVLLADGSPLPPLTYHRRSFGTHTPHVRPGT